MSLNWLKSNKFFATVIFLAIFARGYASILPGQPYDIATFHAWANSVIELGPAKLYREIWTDYLPLPLYFLAGIKQLSVGIGASFSGTLKVTLSLLEVGLILAIIQKLAPRRRRLATLLLLASPALIINSSLWGQLDTLVALFLALSFTISRKNNLFSALLFGISLAMKPIVILTLPVILAQKKKPQKIINWLLITGSILWLTLLPAILPIQSILGTITQPIQFFFKQASYQASVYPYTTINAFNLWSIKGNNWVSDLQPILGITPQFLGLLLSGILILFLYKIARKNNNLSHQTLNAGLILLTFFTFSTRMHERHMIFGLPLIALSATRNKIWIIYAYLILVLLNSANMLTALSWVNNNQSWPVSEGVRIFLSIATVVTVIFMLLKTLKIKIKIPKKKIIRSRQILIILFVALLLRTIGLSSPDKMIFDEVYHAFTAREMVRDNPAAWEWWNTPPEGFAYEWTHPPLAKYFMVAGMLIFGESSFGWRIGSSLVGVLSIYLLYVLTKKWTNKRVALIAASLLTIEGLHLVQSRVAMNDIYMLAFILWALLYASSGKWKHASLLFALALSSKWSAIYGLVPLAYLYIKQFGLKWKGILNSVRYLLISVIAYILLYTPFFISGHTWSQFAELHRQMWYYHTSLTATHGYQSTPLQWIFAHQPVWYFVEYGQEALKNIYAQLNPAIAIIGLTALVLSIIKKKKKLILPIIGYLAFILPWIFSPRIMFIYHYLPSITFLTIILAYWINYSSTKLRRIVLSIIAISFILLLPTYIGTSMPTQYWDTLFKIFPFWK